MIVTRGFGSSNVITRGYGRIGIVLIIVKKSEGSTGADIEARLRARRLMLKREDEEILIIIMLSTDLI